MRVRPLYVVIGLGLFLGIYVLSTLSSMFGDSALELSEVVKLPAMNSKIKYQQAIPVELNKDLVEGSDSVVVYIDNKRFGLLPSPFKSEIKTEGLGLGNHKIDFLLHGKSAGSLTVNLQIVSDIEPQLLMHQVVKEFPHDTSAFTQGLLFANGKLVESTGQYKQSSLRVVDYTSGKATVNKPVDAQFFAEGLAFLNNRFYQLTWQNRIGLIYNDKLEKIGTFTIPTAEGWGLTEDGKNLILSDGSASLFFLDSTTFNVVKTVQVYWGDKPVLKLNELEYHGGFIYANVWQTDEIVKIEPSSGRVLAYLNLSKLLPDAQRNANTDVLNGIAIERASGRVFVTGKNWPKLYELKF
jgi:glutamine cyclotransferase